MFTIRKPLFSLRVPSIYSKTGSFSEAFSSAFDVKLSSKYQFSSAFSQDFAVFQPASHQFSSAFSTAFNI